MAPESTHANRTRSRRGARSLLVPVAAAVAGILSGATGASAFDDLSGADPITLLETGDPQPRPERIGLDMLPTIWTSQRTLRPLRGNLFAVPIDPAFGPNGSPTVSDSILGMSALRIRAPRAPVVSAKRRPSRFHARFDAAGWSGRTESDRLYATHLSERPGTATQATSDQGTFMSRLSLSHAIIGDLELGIAWGSRSRLFDRNLPDLDRQTIGAFVRIQPR